MLTAVCRADRRNWSPPGDRHASQFRGWRRLEVTTLSCYSKASAILAVRPT